MGGNTQDDVDRTMVASGSQAIRYHSYDNFRRIVARDATTRPSVADFLEASDGDAVTASENAETDLAQTYLDRPPAPELIAATRPLYQAAPPPAYVSSAATNAPPAETRGPPSRLATPERSPSPSLAAINHGPGVAPPLASNFANQAVHLAAGQAVSVPTQQFQQHFIPVQAADAQRSLAPPALSQTAYPEPPAHVARPQPLHQGRTLPAATSLVSQAAAAWPVPGGQPMPEPEPRSEQRRLGSVEDLFRMLARRNEHPAPVAAPTASAPAYWLGTHPPAAAIQPEPANYPPFTPGPGQPLSRFASGQHNPGQIRPTPGVFASRFAPQSQRALRPEPITGVGDLFRRI